MGRRKILLEEALACWAIWIQADDAFEKVCDELLEIDVTDEELDEYGIKQAYYMQMYGDEG